MKYRHLWTVSIVCNTESSIIKIFLYSSFGTLDLLVELHAAFLVNVHKMAFDIICVFDWHLVAEG